MYSIKSITTTSLQVAAEYKAEMNACKVNEDLDALYHEIATALSEHGHKGLNIMRRYSQLMQREQDMYDPYDVYEAGRRYAGENDRLRGFMQYMSALLLNPDNMAILQERDNLYYEICGLLGDDERHLLLNDYNEIYRQYHGAVSKNIDYFLI